MLGLIGLIILMIAIFQPAKYLTDEGREPLGGLLSIGGSLVLGGLAVVGLGMAIIIIPILLVIGVIGFIWLLLS